MNAPTKSSVVLVAGSALDDFQHVMAKVLALTNDFSSPSMIPFNVPYVVVLLAHKEMILNAKRGEMSPPVVSIGCK